MAQFSWEQFSSFTYCLSLTKLHISKCEIHIKVKLFPDISISLEQIHVSGTNMITELAPVSLAFTLWHRYYFSHFKSEQIEVQRPSEWSS